MDNQPPAPSKGYQKQVQKPSSPLPKAKISSSTEYSSVTAKKWPQLIAAIESGNIEKLQSLINEGININLVRENATPLMLAASKGQIEIAGVILQAGANVNAKNDDNWTALHKAAYDQADIGIVELLLQSGVDVEAKNRFNKTALQLAEEKGSREIVKIIKQHQAKLQVETVEWAAFLNSPDGKPWKQTERLEILEFYSKFWWVPAIVLGILGLVLGFLLNVVVLGGAIGLVMGLIGGGSIFLIIKQIRSYLDSIGPLPEMDIHILRAKRKAGVPIMVAWKKPVPAEDAELQSDAPAFEGQPAATVVIPVPEEITEKASGGKKINLKMVMYAVAALLTIFLIGALVGSQDAIVRWYYTNKLESKGSQLSPQAFLEAAAKNNEEVVGLFLKAGMHAGIKNENEQTALMIAAENGAVSTIKKFGKLDPSVLNAADKNGNTALMTAARRGDESVVTALVESGADVNYLVPSNEGPATALQAVLDAADFKEENLRIVQYLLQHGANVTAKNRLGLTPLLFAADRGRTDAAKALLESGADVHTTDLQGRFALLTAACKGYSWFVQLLVEKGANLNMVLPNGQTALMCAAREGYGDTVKTLLERGALINAKAAEGATALTEATRTGSIEVATLLLAQGADPASGYLPGAYVGLKGKLVVVNAKKAALNVLLRKISKTASQDGFTIRDAQDNGIKISMIKKGPWNKILDEVATKNNLLLVVKGQDIIVLPYDAAGVKK
jgi:ankyrin repeat protein